MSTSASVAMSDCALCSISLESVGTGVRCKGCHALSYCGLPCQLAHREEHKLLCDAITARSAVEAAPASHSHSRRSLDALLAEAGLNAASLRALAVEGDADCACSLGLCYRWGTGGVSVSLSESFKWFKAAVAAPTPPVESFNALARCYFRGLGVAINVPEAMRLWARGAEAGDVESMVQLGYCLQRGEGTSMDPDGAYEWMLRAADAGHAVAQCNVGFCLQSGYGVAKDPAAAVRYYRRAAVQGNAGAMLNLAGCYRTGEGVEADANSHVVWLQRSRLAGDPTAARVLDELSSRLTLPDREKLAHVVAAVKVYPRKG